MDMRCTHGCCNGLMVEEVAQDFYMVLRYAKCLNCGRTKELAVKEFTPRTEQLVTA